MKDLNKQAAESIVQMIEHHDPIIFIGAGLSIPPYKPWKDLLDELSTSMGIKVKNTENPISAAQELYKSDPNKLLITLKSIFAGPPTDCRPALRDIATIDFKAFLTTNFDQTIEWALQLAKRDNFKVMVYPDLSASLCKKQSVHYVHGRITNTSNDLSEIVFHEESYLNAYYQNRPLTQYLFSVFFDNNVLFTGFGLSKHEPLHYLLESVKITSESFSEEADSPAKLWKILLPKDSFTSEFEEKLKELNIHIILYDKLNEKYEGLDEVWNLVLKTVIPPKNNEPFDPYPKMSKPDWTGL